MQINSVIIQTEDYVKEQMLADKTGHDWQHISRVRKLAVKLAQAEKADLFIVEMAALLHDLDDYKLTNDMSGKLPVASKWLDNVGVSANIKNRILQIITQLSFKGAGVETPMIDIEGCVVQDADRLDAIGAIGVARTFTYGGAKGREMYNPDVVPTQHQSFSAYRSSVAPVINHFYEKLLLLKDRMNTPMAKEIAEKRHQFMLIFLQQFFSEWEGNG